MTNQSDPILALIEAKNAIKAGSRRPPKFDLPNDPEQAAAYVLATIRGDVELISKEEVLTQLAHRKDAALSVDRDESLDEIARSIPVLEAMFLAYAGQATQHGLPDNQFRFVKMALQCHSALIRSTMAIHGLKAQRQGKATVIVNDSGEGEE